MFLPIPPCRVPARTIAAVFLLAALLPFATVNAQSFIVRAKTGDKISALTGKVRQGSFGAPAINSKGDLAFACVLYGKSVNAVTGYSIVVQQKKGKTKSRNTVALQSATTLNSYGPNRTISDDFLDRIFTGAFNVYPVDGTGSLFRICRNISINNQRRVGFSGELVFTMQTDNYQNGMLIGSDFREEHRATYGEIIPSGSTYLNTPVFVYLNYFAEILRENLSINRQGSVPYDADFVLVAGETVPGFAFNGPKGGKLVATTESNVIGLDYETKFQAFSPAVIADGDRCFIVADITDDANDFDGIWQGKTTNLLPIAVKASAAPGGGTYGSFDGSLGPSRSGKLIAFIANVDGGTSGVFVSTLNGKTQSRIASIGDAAPGLNGKFDDFELAAVSNRGHVAILGTAGGTQGIWLTEKNGKGLKLVTAKGEKIKVGKDTKTVRKIAFNPISGINRKGQIAFTATFTDKSSAVVIAEL